MDRKSSTSVLQPVIHDCWRYFIENTPTNRIFREWEKSHLKELIGAYKGYKRTSTTEQKAKAISNLNSNILKSLVIKIDAALGFSLAEKKDDLNKFSIYMVGLILTDNKEIKLSTNEYRLTLLFPEVQGKISNLLCEIDYAKCSLDYSGKTLITEKESNTKLMSQTSETDKIKMQLVSKSKEVEKVQAEFTEEGLISSISALLLDERKEKLTFSEDLTLLLAEFFHAYPTINSRLSDKAQKAIAQERIQSFSSGVLDSFSTVIGLGLSEYFVVLTDIKELPNSRGLVGDVVAVKSFGNKLIPISKSQAEVFFPSRGSVYISPSMLHDMDGINILPVIAERSQSGGNNDFRASGLWDGVVEIVSCKSSFYSFQELLEEIKSFTFKGGKHQVWYKLSDGALISPQSRKNRVTTQAFFDKWRYISPVQAIDIGTSMGYHLLEELPDYVLITMQSDLDIIKELRAYDNHESTLPPHLEVRASYLTNERNSYIRTSEFLENFVSFISSSEVLANKYRAKLDEHISQHSPEIAELNAKLEELRIEYKNKKSQLISLEAKHQAAQSDLVDHLKSSVEEARNDVTKLFKDPYFAAFLPSMSIDRHVEAPTKSESLRVTSPKQLDRLISELDPNKDIPQYIKEMKLPLWKKEAIKQLSLDLTSLINKGYCFEIFGSKSIQLVEFLLALQDKSQYILSISMFAEKVDNALSYVATGGDLDLMIVGIDEKQAPLYANILAYRYQTLSSKKAGIFFCNDSGPVFTSNVKGIIQLDSDKFDRVEGNDTDKEDLADLDSLPSDVPFLLSANEGILHDLIYLSYDDE